MCSSAAIHPAHEDAAINGIDASALSTRRSPSLTSILPERWEANIPPFRTDISFIPFEYASIRTVDGEVISTAAKGASKNMGTSLDPCETI